MFYKRGAGVTTEAEPKRAGATLKNFFLQNSQGGSVGSGRNGVDGSVFGREKVCNALLTVLAE